MIEQKTRPPRPPSPSPQSTNARVCLVFGILGVVLGGWAMLGDYANHDSCASGLVRTLAPAQCAAADEVWTLGGFGVIAGIVLLIVAAIVRPR